MAQNITLLGASYSDVPAVQLPKTGGGTALFYDASGSQTISENGTYDVKALAEVVVSVEGSGSAQTIYCGKTMPGSSVGENGDLFFLMESDGSVERYPAEYTAKNMNSSHSALGNCIGVSAEDGSSTSNVYSSGNNVTGTADYTFDLSDIPSNATITSISLDVKAHEENSSRSTCTVQLYAGSTAKGSVTTVNGTGNTIYHVNCGSWTRSELDSLVMRLSLGYYGGLIAGATLTIDYEAEAQYQATMVGNASGATLQSTELYQKSNGSWVKTESVALEGTITWK